MTSCRTFFSQLSVIILDKDGHRLMKRCQVPGYVIVLIVLFFNESVDFFALDVCTKPIFCSKLLREAKIAKTTKSYSKRQKLPKKLPSAIRTGLTLSASTEELAKGTKYHALERS